MARRLIFHPNIPNDLASTLDYYKSIAAELANRFRQNVNRRLDDIADRPESFPFDLEPIRFAKITRSKTKAGRTLGFTLVRTTPR